MSCFCPVPVNQMMGSLSLLPPTIGLVPSFSMNLVASLGAGSGFDPALSLAANASANASVVANLSAMASLSAALQAALGMNLSAALSASASASARASMAAAVNGFNANAGSFNLNLDMLLKLLADLLGLVNLSGLLLAIKAAFGLDMRASGAMAALQARLAASASASAAASASASASMSVVASLMAALGFKANAQGALAVSAQASATAGLLAGLPSIGPGFSLLSLLNALLAMLKSIHLGLGVNLLAPSAMVNLRLALSLLPLSALAALSATAAVSASASANAALSASAAANAAAHLDLSAVASANLSAAAQVSTLMNVMALGGLGMPAGSCGMPCPLALLKDGPALPSFGAASAAGGAMSGLA